MFVSVAAVVPDIGEIGKIRNRFEIRYSDVVFVSPEFQLTSKDVISGDLELFHSGNFGKLKNNNDEKSNLKIINFFHYKSHPFAYSPGFSLRAPDTLTLRVDNFFSYNASAFFYGHFKD